MNSQIPPSPLSDSSSVIGDAASKVAPHEIRFEARAWIEEIRVSRRR